MTDNTVTRMICHKCKQELSRSTFYRHKNEAVCPDPGLESRTLSEVISRSEKRQGDTTEFAVDPMVSEEIETESTYNSSDDETEISEDVTEVLNTEDTNTSELLSRNTEDQSCSEESGLRLDSVHIRSAVDSEQAETETPTRRILQAIVIFFPT